MLFNIIAPSPVKSRAIKRTKVVYAKDASVHVTGLSFLVIVSCKFGSISEANVSIMGDRLAKKRNNTVKKTASNISSIDILLDGQKFLVTKFHSIG